MTKRSFPDLNVWFALALADHPHHRAAKDWRKHDSTTIGFSRITQLGLLRLLTTSQAMGGMPLTNADAWGVYDHFLTDARVRVFTELPALGHGCDVRSGLRGQ
jgi:predicted nucleic acid-binding protein